MKELKKKVAGDVDVKQAVKVLLIAKMPGCFDREPQPGVNANVDKLVDEILQLVK